MIRSQAAATILRTGSGAALSVTNQKKNRLGAVVSIMNVLRALTFGAFGITIFLAVLVEDMVLSRADVA